MPTENQPASPPSGTTDANLNDNDEPLPEDGSMLAPSTTEEASTSIFKKILKDVALVAEDVADDA
jgi:hypothetical protein